MRPLHVAVDANVLRVTWGGIPKHVRRIAAELAAGGDRVDLLVNLRRWTSPVPGARPVPLRLKGRPLWREAAVPLWTLRNRPDVVWAPEAILPRHIGAPTVATVHDAAPVLFPGSKPPAVERAFRTAVPRSLRSATRVVCVSAAAARDVERLWGIDPARVRIVGNGVDERFTPGDRPPAQAPFGLDEPFVLHVGSLEPRKGLEVLIAAARRSDWRLVLAGSPGYGGERILADARSAGAIHLEGIDDDGLVEPLPCRGRGGDARPVRGLRDRRPRGDGLRHAGRRGGAGRGARGGARRRRGARPRAARGRLGGGYRRGARPPRGARRARPAACRRAPLAGRGRRDARGAGRGRGGRVTRRGVLMVEVGGVGGVSDYTEALVRALAAGGLRLRVVTARDHRMQLPAEVDTVAIVPWVRGHSAPARLVRRAGLGPVVNALGFLALLPRLAVLARRSAVVHFQGGYFLPLTVLFGLVVRATGTPLVQTAHATVDRRRSHPVARRILAACANATIVHTRADLPRLPTTARSRATVIPHGDYGFLAHRGGSPDPAASRAALGLPSGGLVVGLLGQLRPDKGIGDLLEAARAVPAVHVLICGEERGGLAAAGTLTKDPALAGRVVVREGFQEPAELAAALAACDVVALPYPVASASGILLLAYGGGRPVVAYPVGGLGEAVDDGETGWLCARPTQPRWRKP